MENSTDPDQMASSEASCSGSTVFFKICIIVGSAGPGLSMKENVKNPKNVNHKYFSILHAKFAA